MIDGSGTFSTSIHLIQYTVMESERDDAVKPQQSDHLLESKKTGMIREVIFYMESII